MSFSKLTGAAVLLALAPTAMAMGQATVINNCGSDVYYAPVGQSDHAEMLLLQGSYSQSWGSQGNGMSIKLAPSTNNRDVTQFEFTWADGKIHYDISNIDGNPFAAGGMSLVPDMQNDPSNPTCVPINCPAGQSYCDAAYNEPDDVRTHVCDQEANLVFTLCPGGGSASSDSESTSTDSTSTESTSTESTGTESTGTETSSPAPSAVESPSETEAAPTATGGRGRGRPAKREHSRAFRV